MDKNTQREEQRKAKAEIRDIRKQAAKIRQNISLEGLDPDRDAQAFDMQLDAKILDRQAEKLERSIPAPVKNRAVRPPLKPFKAISVGGAS